MEKKCICIAGHANSGKTSLGEAILYKVKITTANRRTPAKTNVIKAIKSEYSGRPNNQKPTPPRSTVIISPIGPQYSNLPFRRTVIVIPFLTPLLTYECFA